MVSLSPWKNFEFHECGGRVLTKLMENNCEKKYACISKLLVPESNSTFPPAFQRTLFSLFHMPSTRYTLVWKTESAFSQDQSQGECSRDTVDKKTNSYAVTIFEKSSGREGRVPPERICYVGLEVRENLVWMRNKTQGALHGVSMNEKGEKCKGNSQITAMSLVYAKCDRDAQRKLNMRQSAQLSIYLLFKRKIYLKSRGSQRDSMHPFASSLLRCPK